MIELAPEVGVQLASLLHASGDREVCGFLLGIGLDVTMLAPTPNACATSGEFAIADADVGRIARLARRHRLEQVAVFHSHPSGEIGLGRDDELALSWSALPWVICVGDARGFRLAAWAPGRPPRPLRIRVA